MKYLLIRVIKYFFPVTLLFILSSIHPGGSQEKALNIARKKQITDFLYVFNIANIAVTTEPIPFSDNGPIAGGFTHIPGTSVILVQNAGIYKINFSVTSSTPTTVPNQFALFVNGFLEETTVFSSGNIVQQTVIQTIGEAIIELPDNAIITLRNTGFAGVILQNNLGRALNINASLIIERLS